MKLHRRRNASSPPLRKPDSARLFLISPGKEIFCRALLLTALFAMSGAHAQLPYTEDFSSVDNRDTALTTADWNTSLEQLRLPIRPSLAGTTFDDTTAVEVLTPELDTRAVALADLDGDSDLDLLVGVLGRTRIHLNYGDGTFTGAVYVAPDAGSTRQIATGDVDRDGDIDFVEGNLNRPIRLYLNEGIGRDFVVQDVSTSVLRTDDVVLVDVDADGLLDVVTANQDCEPNIIFFNTGSPKTPFGPNGQTGTELGTNILEQSREVIPGDIDQDGDVDLVVVNEGMSDDCNGGQPQFNRVFLNEGSGTFTTQIINPGPDDTDLSLSGALGDLNGDGFPDLVVVNYTDGEASKIYMNDASGAADSNPFTLSPVNVTSTAEPLLARTVSLADADNDGDLDIFLTTESNDFRNRIYFNDGDGVNYTMVEVGPVGQMPLSIDNSAAVAASTLGDSVGDLDGDGDVDWVVANFDFSSGSAEPLENNMYRNGGSPGTGSFQQLRALAVSETVDTSGVASVRLAVAAGAVGLANLNEVEYWVSGNGGTSWSLILPDGRPVPIKPGADLRWRAVLRSESPATAASLMLDRLQIDVNQNAPVVTTPVGAVTVREGDEAFGLPIVADFDDADGDALFYYIEGLPIGTGLGIDPRSGGVSGTPTGADLAASPMTVRIVATDGGLTGFDEFTINVEPAGRPPIFDSTPAIAAEQDQPYQYDIVTSDPDTGETAQLVISAPALPGWLTLQPTGAGTATLTGTPMAGDVGDHAVGLIVTDPAGQAAAQDFVISVANVNDAPAFASLPVTNANEYVTYTYDVLAYDPDPGDMAALIISADVLPSWLALTDNGNGSATLTGTPDASHAYTDNSVSLLITDALGATATQDFVVSVTYENDPPVIISSPPVAGARAGSNYVYTIQATDADVSHTELLAFSAERLPDWLSLSNIGGGRARISGTPTAADAASDNTVTVVVSDRDGLTDTQTFEINIVIGEAAPDFVSDPVLNATEGEEYRYSIRAVDPNGDTIAITATTVPRWLQFEETGDGLAVLSGTPSGNDVGTHQVALEAVELAPAGGLLSVQEFVIQVSETGAGPSITLNGEPQVAVLVGGVYDDPGATAFDAEDGDLTQALVVQANVDTTALGTYTVTYSVTDSAGNQAEAHRTVRVVELSQPGGIGSIGPRDLLWLSVGLFAATAIRRSRLSV